MTCDSSGKISRPDLSDEFERQLHEHGMKVRGGTQVFVVEDCEGCAKCKPCTCPTCSLCGLGRMGDGPCGSMENHCLCKPCQECGGEGTIPSDNTSAFFFDGTMNPCPRCNGSGKIWRITHTDSTGNKFFRELNCPGCAKCPCPVKRWTCSKCKKSFPMNAWHVCPKSEWVKGLP